MAKEKFIFRYRGPVQIKWRAGYGPYHEPYNWMQVFDGETTATSKAQAKLFLIYRAKQEGLKKGLTLNNGSILDLKTELIQEVK